jgi:hypothetical protein
MLFSMITIVVGLYLTICGIRNVVKHITKPEEKEE